MNMFKPSKATTIKEYFDLLPENRKEIITKLDILIKKTAPSLKPAFSYNMLGYGFFKYKNYKRSLASSAGKNELIDWPIVSLASQKNYISLYVCALEDGKYIAEKYRDELGKVSVGKSCIRFKKLDDLNLDTLKKVLQKAAKNPGLIITK